MSPPDSATVKLTEYRTFAYGVVRIASSATDQVRVVINLKTAKIGIDIALALLSRADKVIE